MMIALFTFIGTGALKDRAIAPATCGEAIDVPEMVLIAVFLPIHADVIFTPGAIMSTHGPVLLKEARVSALVLAATVMAAGTREGE
jgi:hypothetical protein